MGAEFFEVYVCPGDAVMVKRDDALILNGALRLPKPMTRGAGSACLKGDSGTSFPGYSAFSVRALWSPSSS